MSSQAIFNSSSLISRWLLDN